MREVVSKVALFAEDVGHEKFIRALVRRIATEVDVQTQLRVVSALGGHGRALNELKTFQRTVDMGREDLLIIAIDGNCKGWNKARAEIDQVIDKQRFSEVVIACPDPHVERWYMADPEGLKDILGAKVSPGKVKCERGRYKEMFLSSLRAAGQTVLLGGSEFADEIVDGMDLYRAGKNEPSLKHFLDDLRTCLVARANH